MSFSRKIYSVFDADLRLVVSNQIVNIQSLLIELQMLLDEENFWITRKRYEFQENIALPFVFE